ncbi:Cryptochrome C-terminal [Trema orientale]|uniref:Cryptochrome C-terminal n=1 Tax=Trema orientale TaxID=63057 RepID=A0A2P5ER84_TREOI|nr:Cryptochrome C-terminal [Trema orientale]
MWQQEATSRVAIENGTEEALGDSSESGVICFPRDMQMKEKHEPLGNNPPTTTQSYEDQMVPSMTSSLLRVEKEKSSLDFQISAVDSQAEVPQM